MAKIGLRDLLEAGVHFGHQTRKWNPKMRPFIFIARNGIYIIDLQKTLKALLKAEKFLQDVASKGGTVLFVATKKQAKVTVKEYAAKCGQPYVTERWLGGMLTNWDTISNSVKKLEDIEELRKTGKIEQHSKKEQLAISRSYEKLNRNLGGIRHMTKLPSAVFVIDTVEETTAVQEANKLGIPVIAVVDTNSDPDMIQFPIPGNDDAIRAISLYVKMACDAVLDGRSVQSEGRDVKVQAPAAEEAPAKVTLDETAAKPETEAKE
jgi:small subunit ribosomal protein S2